MKYFLLFGPYWEAFQRATRGTVEPGQEVRTAVSLRVGKGRNLYVYNLVTGDPPPEFTFSTAFGLNVIGLGEKRIDVTGSPFPSFAEILIDSRD